MSLGIDGGGRAGRGAGAARRPVAVALAGAIVAAGAAAALAAAFDPAKAARVVAARKARGEAVRAVFAGAGVKYPAPALYLRAFKREAVLELWAGERGAALVLVRTYPICAGSGELGPKRREGDGQVPEGFYRITVLNPRSAYHLSMGIDYPNAADRKLGAKGRLGGAIFIHGDCVTIGCIPIEDAPIEEVFLAVLDARAAGAVTIPVHIFPARMDAAGTAWLAAHAAARGDARLVPFWEELRPAYEAFERTRLVPRASVEKKTGRYVVAAP